MKMRRRLEQWLRPANRRTVENIFCAQTEAFGRARLLVRCYYAVLLYFAMALLPEWQGLLAREVTSPLWPVAWLIHAGPRAGIGFILALYLAGALAAAFLPETRWARALAFLGLFEFTAFNNSFGKIGHSLHVWILTSALLIFLPRLAGKGEIQSRAARQGFLTVFWACQATILLVYSMSGLGKLAGAIYQMSAGQANAFMPGALAATVAGRLLETNSRSLLGPWLIDHPRLGWPLMLADIYLQFFSFWVSFRPSLHRLWACALILFHILSCLLMTISFPQNALLLALFFFNSPFRPERESWRLALADLPLVGILARRMFPFPCAS